MADDYSNNTSTAGALTPGGQTTGKLETLNDADWFRVALTAGKFYTFDLTVGSPTYYTRLGLLDGDGHMLNISYLSGSNVKYTYKAPTTGTYYLSVYDDGYAAAFSESTYTLKASAGVSDDTGDTRETARIVTVGTKVSGVNEGTTDVDYLKTMLVAGVTYTVTPTWTGVSAGYGTLRVEDASGASVYNGSGNGAFSFTATRTDNYYLALNTWNGAPSNWDVTVTMAEDDYKANKTGAGQLTVGGNTLTGTINVQNDKDWYAASLAAGTTYWFTVGNTSTGGTPFYGSSSLRVLDGDGNVVASNPNVYVDGSTAALVQFKPTVAGTYYLEVGSNSYATGKYTVRAAIGEADDHGDTTATATTVAADTTATGRLSIPQDVDVFKLAVTAGKTYLVELTGQNADGASLGMGATFNGTYTDQVIRYNKPGLTDYRVITATSTGDVYLSISNGNGRGTADYAIKVSTPPQDDYATGSQSTGVLSVGSAVNGKLDYTGDSDTFKVTLQYGAKYAFQLRGAGSGEGTLQLNNNVYLELANSDGNTWSTPLTGNGDGTYTYTSTTGGDYYLTVRPTNNGYGSTTPDAMGSYALHAIALTGDTSAPTLVSYTPHENAGMADTISITFSENIMRGPYSGSDYITLRDSLGVTIESYYRDDQRISIHGNTLTIDPTALLKPGSKYLLSVPAGAVTDLAGNKYAGGDLLAVSTVGTVSAGTAANDYLIGLGTGTKLSGGGGIDTVIYGYSRGNYDVARLSDGTTVTSKSYDNSAHVGDKLDGVERLMFSDLSVALDIDGTAGQAYRLYQAAFNRAPDKAGIGYWMAQMDKGLTLAQVAQGFLNSNEFTTLYGNAPSNATFATKLYTNILHRAPDQAGVDYWVDVLNQGADRANVLVAFSEGVENVSAVAQVIGNGFEYTPYG